MPHYLIKLLESLKIKRVFTEIPNKKLENAILSYAKNLEPKSVVALVDDTLFGSAKNGLIFSDDALYAKEFLGEPKSIKYDEISKIYSQNRTLFINDEKFIDFASLISGEVNAISNALKQHLNTPKQMPKEQEKEAKIEKIEKIEINPQKNKNNLSDFITFEGKYVYTAPNIPQAMLDRILATYGSKLIQEDIQVVVDDSSFFHPVDEIMITNSTIYVYNDKKLFQFRFDDIKSVSCDGKILTIKGFLNNPTKEEQESIEHSIKVHIDMVKSSADLRAIMDAIDRNEKTYKEPDINYDELYKKYKNEFKNFAFTTEVTKISADSLSFLVDDLNKFLQYNFLTKQRMSKQKPLDKAELMKLIYNNNTKLSTIDTSEITDMSGLFRDVKRDDYSGISSWNVKNVISMENMFYGCESFNEPLESWDVSKVENMSGMFSGCKSFNQPLNAWNVENVENTSGMFYECVSFNQPLDNWDIKSLENACYMFCKCANYNQNLNKWNIANIKKIVGMFKECPQMIEQIKSWDLDDDQRNLLV